MATTSNEREGREERRENNGPNIVESAQTWFAENRPKIVRRQKFVNINFSPKTLANHSLASSCSSRCSFISFFFSLSQLTRSTSPFLVFFTRLRAIYSGLLLRNKSTLLVQQISTLSSSHHSVSVRLWPRS